MPRRPRDVAWFLERLFGLFRLRVQASDTRRGFRILSRITFGLASLGLLSAINAGNVEIAGDATRTLVSEEMPTVVAWAQDPFSMALTTTAAALIGVAVREHKRSRRRR